MCEAKVQSKLVFYAQSGSAVISGSPKFRGRDTLTSDYSNSLDRCMRPKFRGSDTLETTAIAWTDV